MTTPTTTPQLQLLKYSKNWNGKLNCKFHTTIRLYDTYKPGELYMVVLQNRNAFRARCITKKVCTLDTLPEITAMLDTGYDLPATKQLLKDLYKDKNIEWKTKDLFIYVFQNIEFYE